MKKLTIALLLLPLQAVADQFPVVSFTIGFGADEPAYEAQILGFRSSSYRMNLDENEGLQPKWFVLSAIAITIAVAAIQHEPDQPNPCIHFSFRTDVGRWVCVDGP